MRRAAMMAVLAAALTSGACYHVTVETGLAPSGQSIRQPWAMSFVAGLVPPPTVETASKCPDGVSRVETQLSFMNGLVAALTGSIVTPMTIEVQCAARRGALLPRELPFSAMISPLPLN